MHHAYPFPSGRANQCGSNKGRLYSVAMVLIQLAGSLPLYHATLSPVLDPTRDYAVATIDVAVRVTDASTKAGRPLLTLPLKRGTTPTQRYDGDAIQASDDSGHLPLSYADTDETDARRTWTPQRDPVGSIIVRFKATPRITDRSTPVGPRIDLRDDQGVGAIGRGDGFLPYPPSDEDWHVQIDWKLPASAPGSVKVASSLGDGPSSRGTGRPKEVLAAAFFAIGPLNRYPPESATSQSAQEFAMYWIGSPPYDMNHVAPLADKIFRSIAHFFGDSSRPFRVFVRRVWTGNGGTGGHRSFLLEYSPGTEEEQTEDSLIDLLAHETVHEYPLMYPEDINDAWYDEGVANYYACIAPFTQHAVDRKYLIKALNNQMQAYYTTDVINLDWKYIINHYWDRYDLTKAGYGRGFIYLCQVQGLIQQATNGKKGVDDIVMALYHKQLRRENRNSADFHKLVSDVIGKEETEKIRAAMEGGNVIVPHPDCFAKYGLKLVRHDVEKFDPGFDPNSIRSGNVTGLVKGSRAEAAGLREGDEIVRSWMLWGAGDALENMMQLTVRQDGGEKQIRYWPRSYDKVENWICIEI